MPSPEQITTAISTIDQLSGWLENAGLDQVAIVQFKFNSLAVMYPELKEVAEIAKSVIGTAFPITEEGMTVTQLANIITENLGKSIKPDRVNKALVELGYQERNEAKRTWSLTEAGKEHGICLLATSAKNSWSGVQVKWYRSVISVLLNYFQENLEESNLLTINSQSIAEPLPEENTNKNGSSNSNSASNQASSKDNSSKKNWTIAERIKEKDLKSNPEQIKLIQSFADDYYLEKYGTKPPKLAGRKVPTSNYPSEAIEIVDRAIETVFNPKKRSES
jgi:transposase